MHLIFTDTDPYLSNAWSQAFEGVAGVSVERGALPGQRVDAWVCPTGARGTLEGGLGGQVKRSLGPSLQAKVWREIGRVWGGRLPVGGAVWAPTGVDRPSYLIPTAVGPEGDPGAALGAAVALGAALHAAALLARQTPVEAVAIPDLTRGQVAPQVAAAVCRVVVDLRQGPEVSFGEVRRVIEAELGSLGLWRACLLARKAV